VVGMTPGLVEHGGGGLAAWHGMQTVCLQHSSKVGCQGMQAPAGCGRGDTFWTGSVLWVYCTGAWMHTCVMRPHTARGGGRGEGRDQDKNSVASCPTPCGQPRVHSP
jgi:hypothetical protein